MAGTRWRSANAASPFRCPTGKLRLNCARAREAQADKYFQEIVEIADAATPETVNVARLRVDSRKFTVALGRPILAGTCVDGVLVRGGIFITSSWRRDSEMRPPSCWQHCFDFVFWPHA